MRFRNVVSAILVIEITRTNAQSYTNTTFVASEISKISRFGITCLKYTVPAAGCSLIDTPCQCASTELIATTSSCMLTNCSLAETLQLAKIQAAICDRPYESRTSQIRIMTIACTVIFSLAIVARLASRLSLHRSLAMDDWVIIAAGISEAIFAHYGVQIESNGYGEHVWNVDLALVPSLLYWFYICELLYLMTICLVKISILLFYLRVFPVKSLHLASWAMIVYTVACTLAFVFVTIFQCQPVEYVWNKDLKGGKCLNYNAVAWANAAINIQQDFLILLLPVSALRRLQLNLRKKIGMYAMFGVGGFVCIASMIRLNSLLTFGLTADPTWDNVPTTFWSTLETATAIFCACMPAIRAGLVRLFPKIMGSASQAPRGVTFMPSTGYALRLPSPEYGNTSLQKNFISSSSVDEARGSESELVAVFSKFNTEAILSGGKAEMVDVGRDPITIRELKPLPTPSERSHY